ncbi:predicted protein [Nematostella vectensis]|uniref:Uncharacterized protein n=1 Tax=Nematostella vectensis TaxID=45351 RepID=A7SU40_NEMVE|nr:predicted protein [Nematostella vectensis]|eukprot:XP_001624872.1 predicted protein [Nematostella vectensis]
MAKRTTLKRVVLLYTEDQADRAEKLRTVLESESDGDIEIRDLMDVEIGKLSLEDELRGCDSIVLICSPLATELIDNENSSVFIAVNGRKVTFDGRVINKVFRDGNGNMRERLIPVSFVDLPKVWHASGRKGRKGPICFGAELGKLTERMLEGDVLQSLMAVIRGKKTK